MDAKHYKQCAGEFWVYSCFFELLRRWELAESDEEVRKIIFEFVLRHFEFSDAGARWIG